MSVMSMNTVRSSARCVNQNDADVAVRENGALLGRCVRRAVARTGKWHLRDDFWVAAAVALVDARARWEAQRGVPFSAFVERRIRGAIADELRRYDHLPRRMRFRANSVRRARETLRGVIGREPTCEEVSAHVGTDAETVRTLEAVANPPEPVLNEEGHRSAQESAPDQLERRELQLAVGLAVARLPERLREIVAMRYVQGISSREMAERLGVSEPRVSQLHAAALKQLRAMMDGQRA